MSKGYDPVTWGCQDAFKEKSRLLKRNPGLKKVPNSVGNCLSKANEARSIGRTSDLFFVGEQYQHRLLSQALEAIVNLGKEISPVIDALILFSSYLYSALYNP